MLLAPLARRTPRMWVTLLTSLLARRGGGERASSNIPAHCRKSYSTPSYTPPSPTTITPCPQPKIPASSQYIKPLAPTPLAPLIASQSAPPPPSPSKAPSDRCFLPPPITRPFLPAHQTPLPLAAPAPRLAPPHPQAMGAKQATRTIVAASHSAQRATTCLICPAIMCP